MKIVHLSFWDKQGGAAIAANRLHKNMILEGNDSKMLVFDQFMVNDSTVISVASRMNKIFLYLLNVLESRILSKFRPYIGNFSISYFGLHLSNHKSVIDADVIYIHWINNNLISISEIGKILKTTKPVVWFLHDMWPMTGGCHHSFDCTKYQSHCHSCDLLKSNKEHDISFKTLKNKIEKIGPYNNLTVVVPSEWMKECARQSFLFRNKRIALIPNLVDVNKFKPHDKIFAKNFFNLPLEKKVILFGADMGETNPYKGWTFLRDALEIIESECVIVTFGGESLDLPGKLGTLPLYSVGKLFDEYSLILLYNACDVFVMPSLAEAFGQTALEAISCGTPAVGFNVGGLPDIIKHKETGYLVNYKDSFDLATGIDWVLNNELYDKLSLNCVNHASTFFS